MHMDYAKLTTDKDGNPMLANPGTDVARIISGVDVNGNYARQTSKWVEDGSFVRLKNISLSYNIPTSLISRQKIGKRCKGNIWCTEHCNHYRLFWFRS